MANVFGVHSVGSSIVTFLRNTYPGEIDGRALPACAFELVSAGQLAGEIEAIARGSEFSEPTSAIATAVRQLHYDTALALLERVCADHPPAPEK